MASNKKPSKPSLKGASFHQAGWVDEYGNMYEDMGKTNKLFEAFPMVAASAAPIIYDNTWTSDFTLTGTVTSSDGTGGTHLQHIAPAPWGTKNFPPSFKAPKHLCQIFGQQAYKVKLVWLTLDEEAVIAEVTLPPTSHIEASSFSKERRLIIVGDVSISSYLKSNESVLSDALAL